MDGNDDDDDDDDDAVLVGNVGTGMLSGNLVTTGGEKAFLTTTFRTVLNDTTSAHNSKRIMGLRWIFRCIMLSLVIVTRTLNDIGRVVLQQ